MEEKPQIDDGCSEERRGALRRHEAVAVWQHYSNTGGADKERMVTIATWLLAFSATAIGYAITHFIQYSPTFHVKDFETAAVVAVWGLFVSIAGAIVVLVYAGYANWNWANADGIARTYSMLELLPDTCRAETTQRKGISRFVMPLAEALARPKDPRSSLAPVFWIFLALVLASLVAHAVLLTIAFTHH